MGKMGKKFIIDNVVQYLDFITYIRKFGVSDKKKIFWLFKRERELGHWKNFDWLRKYNNRTCECECICNLADSFGFIRYFDCENNKCKCKCFNKDDKLSIDETDFIVNLMKNIGYLVTCDDFKWYSQNSVYTLQTHDEIVNDLIIKHYNFTERDIITFCKAYSTSAHTHIRIIGHTLNILRMHNHHTKVSYSS